MGWVKTDGMRMEELLWVLGEAQTIYKTEREEMRERERDVEGERALTGLRSQTEWKERWLRGDGERERWVEGRRERDLCALHFSLWSGDVLGWSQWWEAFPFLFLGDFYFFMPFLQTHSPPPLDFILMDVWKILTGPWWKRNCWTSCIPGFMYEMRSNTNSVCAEG